MTKPVKTALHSFALLGTIIFGTITANAGVIDVPNVPVGVNSYRAFQDTTTNLVWLDLDNVFFTNHTYNTVVALLSGSGFHLASLAELQALQASIPAVPANFSVEAPIVGANYPGSPHALGSRGLMWGIYEDGDSLDGISYSWKYDSDSSWNIANNVMGENTLLRDANSSDQDLGAWAVGSAQTVPEPGTLSLLGAGLVGVAISRLRNRQA